jgi:hypothetical protein
MFKIFIKPFHKDQSKFKIDIYINYYRNFEFKNREVSIEGMKCATMLDNHGRFPFIDRKLPWAVARRKRL